MGDPKKFNHEQVASLAADLATITRDVTALRDVARTAQLDLNRAELALRNKQADFTRAVESQLDHSVIKSPPIEFVR